MTEKTFREKLLEKGAPRDYLDKFTEEELEQLKRNMEETGVTEDYVALLLQFQDYLGNFDKYRRRRISLTLASPIYDLVKYIAKDLTDAEGNPYPLSYLIEDMLVWLLRHPEHFQEFLEETYTEEDEDGSEEEEAEGKES